MPNETIDAFADHGTVRATVEGDVEEAQKLFEGLQELGIDFDFVTDLLLHEGVQKFIDPFDRAQGAVTVKNYDIGHWPDGRQRRHCSLFLNGSGFPIPLYLFL